MQSIYNHSTTEKVKINTSFYDKELDIEVIFSGIVNVRYCWINDSFSHEFGVEKKDDSIEVDEVIDIEFDNLKIIDNDTQLTKILTKDTTEYLLFCKIFKQKAIEYISGDIGLLYAIYSKHGLMSSKY